MINVAVIDDAQVDRQLLLRYLERFCDEKHLLAQIRGFESGEDFLQDCGLTEYAIVFLDIYLGGMDGMQIAQKIREHGSNCLIVFCTSSDQHAVSSYRVRAFDYLVKPFSYEQLCEVMDLCSHTLTMRARYIEVKESRVRVKIPLADIVYVDYYKHYVQLHTKERLVRSYIPFREIAQQLLQFPQFLCCYHDLIINMDEVSSLDERDVLMKSGERIPVAASRRAGLRQSYADYALSRLERDL